MSAPATLEITVTYLEMLQAPASPPPPVPAGRLAMMRADALTVGFYRFLYNSVGQNNLWWERRILSDEDLAAEVISEDVEVFVLYFEGTPAGYFELKTEPGGALIDLAYFGLLPDFIGRGLGAYLLRCAVDEAWRRDPERLTVNTCSLDHPQALINYQRAGFSPYNQVKRTIDNPANLGIF